MNKDINLDKVKEYANNLISLYSDTNAADFNAWFESSGYEEVQDCTEEMIAEGLVQYYMNDIIDNE